MQSLPYFTRRSRTKSPPYIEWALFGIFICIVAFGLIVAIKIWSINHQINKFDDVAMGDSIARVLRVMGAPTSKTAASLPGTFWDDTQLKESTSDVAVEYHHVINTFSLPIDQVVQFDRAGKVIGKHQLD